MITDRYCVLALNLKQDFKINQLITELLNLVIKLSLKKKTHFKAQFKKTEIIMQLHRPHARGSRLSLAQKLDG